MCFQFSINKFWEWRWGNVKFSEKSLENYRVMIPWWLYVGHIKFYNWWKFLEHKIHWNFVRLHFDGRCKGKGRKFNRMQACQTVKFYEFIIWKKGNSGSNFLLLANMSATDDNIHTHDCELFYFPLEFFLCNQFPPLLKANFFVVYELYKGKKGFLIFFFRQRIAFCLIIAATAASSIVNTTGERFLFTSGLFCVRQFFPPFCWWKWVKRGEKWLLREIMGSHKRLTREQKNKERVTWWSPLPFRLTQRNEMLKANAEVFVGIFREWFSWLMEFHY